MTAEPLRELLRLLEEKTKELEESLAERDSAENAFKVAKSRVESTKNQRDLIREKIMAEKMLIRTLN